MIRMQVQLTEQQAAELRRRARARGTSAAALVREAIDRELIHGPRQQEVWQRALAAVGRYPGDRANVASEHDAYLADAVARK
jgi:hypothetical protein